MNTLRLMLSLGVVLGLNSQVQASTAEIDAIPKDRAVTTSALTREEARVLYDQGIDLRIQGKLQESFVIIKQAADAGWKWAQYTLGSMYLGGIGTDIDVEKAFDYYEICCDEIAEAANQMGVIYEGIFPQTYEYENSEEALKCYKRAADLGLPVGRDNYKRLMQSLGK